MQAHIGQHSVHPPVQFLAKRTANMLSAWSLCAPPASSSRALPLSSESSKASRPRRARGSDSAMLTYCASPLAAWFTPAGSIDIQCSQYLAAGLLLIRTYGGMVVGADGVSWGSSGHACSELPRLHGELSSS